MSKNIKILFFLVVVILIGAFVFIQMLRSKQNAQIIKNTLVTEEKTTTQSPIAYEVINGITVPPEPDPELNNATLAGIDVNGNGVRDDVERWIVTKFSDSEKRRTVLFELGVVNRESLLAADASDSTSAMSAVRRSDAAIACLNYIDPTNAASIENQFASAELNTKQRWDTNAKLQKLLGGTGMTIPADKKALCTFDPDLMKN